LADDLFQLLSAIPGLEAVPDPLLEDGLQRWKTFLPNAEGGQVL
jgi:hypothetical protein